MSAGGAVKTERPTDNNAKIAIQNLQSPDKDLTSGMEGKEFCTVDPTSTTLFVAVFAALIAVISASLL